MHRPVAPIGCKPWALSGISEEMIVGHYENEYGRAVRRLNALRDELAAVDLAELPAYQVRAIKREEAEISGSVLLHELYFAILGGDGGTRFTGNGSGGGIPETIAVALERDFGTVTGWRRQFAALSTAMGDRPGWVVLSYSRSDRRLHNHIATNPAEAMIDSAPLIALDLYEHAYYMDFGANVGAYVDAFMRNVDWVAVADRFEYVTAGTPSRPDRAAELPAVSVEDLETDLTSGVPVQVIDARPKHYFSRARDMMEGATWHDPDQIDEWVAELSPDAPVVVYCAYGFAVGCGVAAMLRDRGLDAKHIRGGLSAWYAAGGRRVLKPPSNASE